MTDEKRFDIWIEGYAATGEQASARCLATDQPGTDFANAVERWVAQKEREDPQFKKNLGDYDPIEVSIWGCSLYPNEEEARATFG